jgi:hypothetical protein
MVVVMEWLDEKSGGGGLAHNARGWHDVRVPAARRSLLNLEISR